jgi:hypothetical protein
MTADVHISAFKEEEPNVWIELDDEIEGEDDKTELERYLGALYDRSVTFSHPISQFVIRDQVSGELEIGSEIPTGDDDNTDTPQGISLTVRWDNYVLKITFGGWGVPSNTGNFVPVYEKSPQ